MAVRWAAENNLILNVHAPLTVTAELVRQSATDRMMLHLVNYENSQLVPNIEVSLEIPRGKKVKAVRALSPDSEDSGDLTFREADGRVHFTVLWLRTYTMVVISLASV